MDIKSKIKVLVVDGIGRTERNTGLYTDELILAVGSSTGGTEAFSSVLKVLPENTPGILLVQHMPANFTKMYADRLNNVCAMEVREAKDGDKVCMGKVLVAPGEYHMRLKKRRKEYFVECCKGDRVSGHCPSVDVLFESVAEAAGQNAIGVIMTGMGSDGAKGLLSMRQRGARTVGQDEKTCVVYGMPKVAYDMGAVEKQVALDEIPTTLLSLIQGRQLRM